MIAKLWRWFWRPSARYGWGAILITGGAAGIVLWAGFNTAMEYTNTLEFCVSCHEMEQLVFVEYKKTVHFANRTGVRVICSDCHVPKEFVPKIIRKIRATNELYHTAVGTISTPERFEDRRLELAQHVWETMASTGSRECRNCHDFGAMDFKKQGRRPREKHPEAMEEGKTCIDCHKGVAHKLPEDYED